MKQITITINGKEITAAEGKTILEVVHENKLDKIPTLCYDGRIEPYGSCFLCVVEIQGMNRLVASCCTPIAQGMVIFTDNEKIRNSRKTALELLLSNHYADCIGPCINNCPANVDAQGYIALISMGKYDEALQLIKKQNPLPLSIGRVCVRDCEVACRRQIIDESVAINHLKRYVADIDAGHHWTPELKKPTGKKIAVVGGGPSGLTCAYYSTLEGHKVTIFEKLPRLGGMLMYGIPEYRLPKAVLDDEINWITGLGVDVKTNAAVGKDFDIQSLFKDGFDAVYLAVGAHKASTMRIEHEEDTVGVMGGIDFLRQLPEKHPKLEGTVIVVGGGNTAIDAARTALRCGADKVRIVYRRSINEMPAHPEEVHAAQAENIEILFLTNPKGIVRDENKKLKGIVCLKMELVAAGPGERPKPVPKEGSDFELPCDFLIGAIGQQVDTDFNKVISASTSVDLEKWGTVKINNDTMETSIQGVFAGGDAVTGPDTAINSIGQGKRAARAIDFYLKYGKVEKSLKPFYSFKHKFSEVTQVELSHFPKTERNRLKELPVAQRVSTFDEVEFGYSGEQAQAEPKRCLECGCSEYYDCDLRRHADDFNIDISTYMGETRKYKVDTRHPFIVMDPNKCINCGRCVRTCSEILKVSALGFVYRGFKSVVKPAMEKPLLETNCIACGNCVDNCPTGALTEKFPFKVLGTLPKQNIETVCNFCSIGCKVNFKVIDDNIFFVSNSTEELKNSLNRGYLCVKGRFGHRYLMDSPRLKQPLMKDSTGGFKEVGWDKAIDHTAERVKSIIAKYGPQSVAVFGSPRMSNEELYLLQKFTRAGLKTNNTGSFYNVLYGKQQDSLDSFIGYTASTVSMDSLRTADVVVVVNGNLSEENLVMELNIKEAQKKNGTKLILLNSSEIILTKTADLWIDSRKGSNTVLLNSIIRHVIEKGLFDKDQASTPGFEELKQMAAEYTPEEAIEAADISTEKYNRMLEWIENPDRKIVFIYNIDSVRDKSPNDLKAIGNFLQLTGRLGKNDSGSGIIILSEYANSAGLMDMGVTPRYLPGYVKEFEKDEIKRIGNAWGVDLTPIFQPADLADRLLKGEIKALLIFGEDPLNVTEHVRYFKGIEFLMVQDLVQTDTAAEADVVFPAASFIEQAGTYTACDGRIQETERIVSLKVDRENWKLIAGLAAKFGLPMDYASIEQVNQEIRNVNRSWNGSAAGKNLNETGKPQFSVYSTDMSVYQPEMPVIHYPDSYFKLLQEDLKYRSAGSE